MRKNIRLVVADPDREHADVGDKPIETTFISPEGADPNREVPGFFIIQLNGETVKMANPPPDQPWMPRQFLSLDAVYEWLRETYGWTTPLRIIGRVQIEPRAPQDFPAVWGAERRDVKRNKIRVRVRYLGSFHYWNGRRVDPTKVGTKQEFN